MIILSVSIWCVRSNVLSPHSILQIKMYINNRKVYSGRIRDRLLGNLPGTWLPLVIPSSRVNVERMVHLEFIISPQLPIDVSSQYRRLFLVIRRVEFRFEIFIHPAMAGLHERCRYAKWIEMLDFPKNSSTAHFVARLETTTLVSDFSFLCFFSRNASIPNWNCYGNFKLHRLLFWFRMWFRH